MKSRYEVWCKSVSLSSIHPDIQILDISYKQPRINNSITQLAKKDGGIVTKRYIDKCTVSITFELHIYNTVERQEVCSQIIKWADNNGYPFVLETSDKPDKYIFCICDSYPSINSAMKWTEPLTITFSSYYSPFWKDVFSTSFEINDTNIHDEFVSGNYGFTRVGVTMECTSAVSNFTVLVNSSIIKINGLSTSIGDIIRIWYDESDTIHIVHNNVSIMDKRTSDSSDDLLAKSGQINSFMVSAGVKATFTMRGVWL